MNFIEMLVFISVVSGAMIGVGLAQPTSLAGIVAYALGGASVPSFLVWLGITVINRRLRLPTCAQRRCSPDMYRLVRKEASGAVYQCQCGDLYLKQDETRVDRLDVDGARHQFCSRLAAGTPWLHIETGAGSIKRESKLSTPSNP